MIESIAFSGLEPGPKLLVLGAVHGNEKCGAHAIRRIVKEIEEARIVVTRGSVSFVPVCNPRAFEADVRFIDRNLNRYLVPQHKPNCYEARLGNVLCPILASCDVLLDLHSYISGGAPFVFIGSPGTPEHDFANCLGAAAGITGWTAAHADSTKETKADPEESTGTTEYARRFGARCVTLECGQNNDPASVEIAYRAIKNALAFLELAPDMPKNEAAKPSILIEVKKVCTRDNGGAFVKAWKHLEPVRANEIIAKDAAGAAITAPGDGYLILPHADTLPGTEWFYWGQLLRKGSSVSDGAETDGHPPGSDRAENA